MIEFIAESLTFFKVFLKFEEKMQVWILFHFFVQVHFVFYIIFDWLIFSHCFNNERSLEIKEKWNLLLLVILTEEKL